MNFKEAIKLADRDFSKFIRVRDCLRTTGTRERGRCFTCGDEHPIAELQCGHFITRDCKTLRFHPKNAHAQNPYCNMVLSGNIPVYRINMLAYHGEEIVNEFRKIRYGNMKFYTPSCLVDLAADFRKRTKELTVENCGRPFPFICLAKGKKNTLKNPNNLIFGLYA